MREAIRVLALMDATGLLKLRDPVVDLRLSTLREAAHTAARAGIGRNAAAVLDTPGVKPRLVLLALRELAAALEESPFPEAEARELGRLFGWESLATMVDSSPASLRRYASAKRETPDDVAGRLHLVAKVVGGLKGAYNETGIRRWFERPRTQLGGRAPRDVLHGEWTPDQSDVVKIRSLADSLLGAGST